MDYVRTSDAPDFSLRDLAGSIGTSHRMLVYHFGSREALLIEIVRAFEAEQSARMRALLRRGTPGSPTLLQVGDLTLDPAKRIAKRGHKEMRLSATEFALLEYLMRNVGKVLTRTSILEHVWQYHFNGNDNVLDVYIGYLRSKIDKGFENPLIHTVRGVGFQMSDRREAKH